MTDLATLDPIDALQAEMLKHPQVECETADMFIAGRYVRAVFRKAGVLIVGKRHKKPHLYFIVSGTVRVGQETYTGPHFIECQPGTKRAVYALTDALCLTVHETLATDTEAAEADLVDPEPDSPFLPGNRLPQKVLSA